MALPAKTPTISLHSDLQKPHSSNFHGRKNLVFSNPTKKLHKFPLKRAHNTPSRYSNSYLTQLCLENQLEQAIKIISSLQKDSQNSLDEETFISVIRLCEFKRAFKEGCLIYEYVLNFTSQLSLKLGNALLSMFVRLGNLDDAWYVFGKMEERNVFSWNVLIGGYAKNGFFDEALDLYYKMLWAGVRPDVYTFPCVLRTCGGLGGFGRVRGRAVHAHVVRFGFEVDVDVNNAVITMYVKCGDLRNSMLVFDRMPRRDRISWNAMISGYFENGECLKGLELFCSMREFGFEPDLMTMTSVISACEVLGDERYGRGLHGLAVKNEFGVDVSVGNTLIQMYSSVGKWDDAERVFDGIEFKDVISWTSMISGYESNALPEKAVETYEMMEMDGIVADEITIASVLSACTSLDLLDMGISLHELARSTGLISCVIVANTLIDFYFKCKLIDKALEVFHQMREKDVVSWTSVIVGLKANNQSFEALIHFRQMKLSVNPNDVTLVSVLSSCGRVGALMCGKEIHSHLLRNGLEQDGFLPNAILDMYVKCGKMFYAWNQFNRLKHDAAAWNILLTGYAQQRQGSQAEGLFQKMLQFEVAPDEITFLSLLCACSRSGMVSEGLDYFGSMKGVYDIVPNLKHYACVVDLLGRAGKVEEALEFINKMPMKPDAAIWGALLNSCRIYRRFDEGEIAARHIYEMDKEFVEYYILLCNFYSECGKWDEVARMQKMMREKGATVDPGCSWVEVKGQVHAFLSGDNFHPSMKEMSAVLQGFYDKMKADGLDDPMSQVKNEESAKADVFCGHSERYAIAFALINTSPGMPILITKNLYTCRSCHSTLKYVSKVVRREISLRDTEHFHHFKDGICTCGDEGFREDDSGFKVCQTLPR